MITAFPALEITFLLFWDITQRSWVVSHWCFLDSLTLAGGTERLRNVTFQKTEDPNGNSLCT